MKANATTSLVITGFAGFLIYLVISLTGSSGVRFDEPIHLGGVAQLDRYGFGPEFLRHLPAGPGPLFTMLHQPLEGLTGLRPPWVRLINPVLFLAIIILLNGLAEVRWLGINLMGSPFMSIPIGMALTEIPAMFCICASLLLLFKALDDEKKSLPVGLALALGGGFCLGLAMLGRQTYLIALPAFFALWRSRRDFLILAVYGILAVAMIVPLFVIWGGLVPPFDKSVETGFRPDHGFFAFAFLGLATLIIEPRFFIMPWRWLVTVAVVAGVVNFTFRLAIIYPMDQVIRKFLPHAFIQPWIIFCSTLFAVLAAVTLVAYLRLICRYRHQPRYLFAMIAAALILFGCMRMVQSISSRYITTALPFWLIGLQPLMQDDRWKPYRFAVAIAVGAVILWSYLHGADLTNQGAAVTVPAAQ